MLKIFIATTLLFSVAYAEEYFVEPLVCTARWEKQPKGAHESYEYATLTITSFKSVRANDCSLVDSTGTATDFGKDAFDGVNLNSSEGYLGSWFGGPLEKNGSKVQVPFGVWGAPLELSIINTNVTDGAQFDTLTGREKFQDTFYNLICQARVVKTPTHIENNTKNCKP
ncbi:MAG: hypothetical protein K2Q26_07995 [Bdellovibrionales bacterium]|nr:hypothetical protein [Bdellovibrionales bacterium]